MGSTGAVSVRKLIKETKVNSWLADESRVNQFLSSKTKPDVGTACARVLGETDAAMREEISGFNLLDCVFDQMTEFFPLLISYCRWQILNFRHSFADKDDLRDIGDARNPGIADQLWVER